MTNWILVVTWETLKRPASLRVSLKPKSWLKGIAKSVQAFKQGNEPEKKEFTEKEVEALEAEAAQYLDAQDILTLAYNALKKLGLVGEEANAKATFLDNLEICRKCALFIEP